ncbi:SAV_915 family protein [Streptomyces sp. Wb2n-11]|uniref:SAV_915 family protein n=1 Tax=Streptomyces sp. Wb2n-11 TaxID=1030533 RepID=UPI000A3F55B9
MADVRHGGESTPGGHAPTDLLYVPVRSARRCYVTCFFRTPGGRRTAVAFTTSAQLRTALGQDHRWIRISAAALDSLTSPLGCTVLTVDPRSSAPPGSALLRVRSDTGEERPGVRPNR